jgi:NADPH:quinone reductase-like Zn-dependent oxidoreductase
VKSLKTFRPDYIVSLNGTEQQADEIVKATPQGKFGFIDDPKSFDVMAFKHKAVSTHIEFIRSMFQTEDLQKQHEILNEVARLIDLGMIKPL